MDVTGKCPFCGSTEVLAGNIAVAKGACGFRPDGVKTGLVFTFRSPYAFNFGPAAQFCAKCCMVWSRADRRDAAKFLRKFAEGPLKARLEAGDTIVNEQPELPAGPS